MDKNPFLDRLMKINDKGDIFHSSAYGKAQNGGSMGAASTESFATRRQIEQNRTVIKGYGSSSVARSVIGNGPRAKTYMPPAKNNVGLGPRPMAGPKNPGISR